MNTMLKPLLICVLISGLGVNARANEILPPSINHETAQFELCSDFTLRYGLVIKVADIGWYAPDCQQSTSLLDADNKILRFHYHKNVSADFFRESAEEYFLLNLDNQEQQRNLVQPLMEFNQGYTDIKSGEYFDLVHWQDKQLNLFKNNQLLASTTNPILANKYFNIWFGKSPVIDKLKRAFLK